MLRILFVDDEVNVLQGMRRAMHGMRREWEMEFATSGPEALRMLAVRPAEVIVSDMRMPGMDGWELLQEVKRLYPDTVRLVLSGYAERGSIMRLVGTAHQYIAKPGDSAAVKAAIAQTQIVRQLLNNSELKALVSDVGTLPTFPATFQEISECLRRSQATVTDAATIIGRDVGMTANIMKLVNSAFFGARRPITSVERAVAYLGLDTLTALVLAHGLFHARPTDAIAILGQHCLQTALAARAIALQEKLPGPEVEEAFLAGILHDVGRLVIAARDDVRTAANEGGVGDPPTAEDSHAEVGAYLLGLWGFPSHIVAAVALHECPGRVTDAGLSLTLLVHVANRLVQPGIQDYTDPASLGIDASLLEASGLSDRLPRWAAAVQSIESSLKEAS